MVVSSSMRLDTILQLFFKIFFHPKFFFTQIFFHQNYFHPKFSFTQNFFSHKYFFHTIFFHPKFFFTQNFFRPKFFSPNVFFHPNFFQAKFFSTQNVFNRNLDWYPNVFEGIKRNILRRCWLISKVRYYSSTFLQIFLGVSLDYWIIHPKVFGRKQMTFFPSKLPWKMLTLEYVESICKTWTFHYQEKNCRLLPAKYFWVHYSVIKWY